MEIILKIFAGLTGFFGLIVLFSASQKNFSHIGMTLGGVAYLLGGAISLYILSWWPVTIGIILAIIIKKLFGEPDYGEVNYERAPEYGIALSKEETSDIDKVGKFIMAFLKADSVGVHIFSGQAQNWAEIGFLNTFSIEIDKVDPVTTNIVPWFMNRMRLKIQALPNYSSTDFNQMVRNLNSQSGEYLETIYQITEKYDLDIDEFRINPSNFLTQLSKEDGTVVSFALFADIIIHTELRLLQYLFSWWNPVETAS